MTDTEAITIHFEETPPPSSQVGYCDKCGKEIVRQPGQKGRLPKFCDEHKGSSSKSVSKRVRSTGKVTDQQATGTIAKLLVIITLVLMYGRIKRLRIPDASGELAEALAMTDEEAFEVARPLARFGNGNPVGARVIGPLVKNEDVIGAMFALYEYNRRTDQIFRSLTQGEIPANHPERNSESRVHPEEASEDRSTSGNGQYPTGGTAYDFATII